MEICVSQIRESISNVSKTMKNKISAMGMAVAPVD